MSEDVIGQRGGRTSDATSTSDGFTSRAAAQVLRKVLGPDGKERTRIREDVLTNAARTAGRIGRLAGGAK